MKTQTIKRTFRACGLPALLLFLLICNMGYAQSITWTFVSAAGMDDGPGCSLRWTMGEPLNYEVSGNEGSLRMGFLPFAYTENLASATMEINRDLMISLYPNPASDRVTIQLPDDTPRLLRILSIDGMTKMASDIGGKSEIDIRPLPAGTYVLYILDSYGTYNATTFIKL